MRLAPRASSFVVAVVFVAACSSSSNNAPKTDGGGGTGGGKDGSAGSGGSGQDGSSSADLGMFDVPGPDSAMSMSLTSSALAAGAAFAPENTCAGVNTSPPLNWTAGPSGTMSYAVSLTDLTFNGVTHWVIWDIPAATMNLAAALPDATMLTTPAGAKQVHKAEFFGVGGGYRGPCPAGANHVYQFQVNAIPTLTLAGVTAGEDGGAGSTVEQVKAAVLAASIAHGDLAGTSNAMMPAADAAAGN